jgi:integrase/recombinase XerD
MSPKSTLQTDWQSAFKRLEGAYSPATMRSYRSDVEAFVRWCREEGIEAPFPADPETLCEFLEAQICKKTPSTIKRRLCAIRLIHNLLDLPDATRHQDVKLEMRRACRSKPMRPKQAKGMTRPYLNKFIAVQPKTPTGLRNRAMLSLGYELLTRRSELIAIRTDEIDWRDDGTLRVLIRRSKSDQFGNGRIAFTSQRTAGFVQEWLEWRGEDITPLFCPIYKDQPIDRALEVTTIKRLVKDAAKRAGLNQDDIDAFSGHSMRVGAAQDLLTNGFDTVAIMRAGGWKSVGVLARYLELAEHNVWA